MGVASQKKKDHGHYGSIQDTRRGGLCFGSVDLYQEYFNLMNVHTVNKCVLPLFNCSKTYKPSF